MLIECLIKRDGPTRINLHGFDYEFKMNGRGHCVALVNSREHRNYLLSLPDFREYHPPTITPIPPAEVGDVPIGNRKRAYRRCKEDHSG